MSSSAVLPTEAQLSQSPVKQLRKTRKSIQKYFQLGKVMSIGQDNPFTIHAVDEEMFRCFWSLFAETMVVDGALKRPTKEKISVLVSKKNDCQVCLIAHHMLKQISDKVSVDEADPYLEDALVFAEEVLMASHSGREIKIPADTTLSTEAQAEVALIVLVKTHMNRTTSALVGEQLSTAAFGVPRVVAKRMESKGAVNVFSKLLAPFLARGIKAKYEPGITRNLFKHVVDDHLTLPSHLKGATLAGAERGIALARMHAAMDTIYETRLEDNILPRAVVHFVDDAIPPAGTSPGQMSSWILVHMRKSIAAALPDENHQSLAALLLFVAYSPKSIQRLTQWEQTVKRLGLKNAKLLVLWFSMRFTLLNAAGLEQAQP
ncbi:hypothetical protein FisN_5Hh004 [Fistulifera solaris]|uniref:Carboxymuconolactone decarboxylase-like domain-containing protein n=1 Tax=Fistulifera solaris TaxID=1519565 RepID=A0A1Z5K9X6_FISSO|nr:hypothetical protein FisN_5Hh004 [Fistulifera solaris]|eukprot:GAX22738.1 hypothetical protein FisN_5Hh004 [Fistulifera solaris]